MGLIVSEFNEKNLMDKNKWTLIIVLGLILSIVGAYIFASILNMNNVNLCRIENLYRFCRFLPNFDFLFLMMICFSLFDVFIYHKFLKNLSEFYYRNLIICVLFCFVFLYSASFFIFWDSISPFGMLLPSVGGVFLYPFFVYFRNDFLR